MRLAHRAFSTEFSQSAISLGHIWFLRGGLQFLKMFTKKLSTPVRPLAGCASSLPAAEAERPEYDDVKVKEVKEVDLYSAFIEVPSLKALRYGSHSVTCKLHRTCLYLVSIHQMAHPQTEVADI